MPYRARGNIQERDTVGDYQAYAFLPEAVASHCRRKHVHAVILKAEKDDNQSDIRDCADKLVMSSLSGRHFSQPQNQSTPIAIRSG